MTLYEIIRRTFRYHDSLLNLEEYQGVFDGDRLIDIKYEGDREQPDSFRDKTAFSVVLQKVLSLLPLEFRNRQIQDLIGNDIEGQIRIITEEEFEQACRGMFAVEFAIKIYEQACLVPIADSVKTIMDLKLQLQNQIPNGELYHFLSDLYGDFPDYCDKCFSLERT